MKLSAPHRIAMTGTPVENRLAELWSIFHFLIRDISAPLTRSVSDMRRERRERFRELHKLVSPFIAQTQERSGYPQDLPEKLELKSYCPLTEVQGAMYQAVVDEMMGQIESRTGMARKGLVLSSLTKLKQICDHPLLRRDEGRAVRAESSGKMERMLEILDSIADVGESALILPSM